MKFDLSKIELSNIDRKKDVTLPKKPSKELAEFIGIIIGDGYLHNNKNKYVIGVVGHPEKDLNYFHKIQRMIYSLFNIKTKIKKRGRGLRLIFNSKGAFYFLTLALNLEYGKGKGQRIKIPSIIMRDSELSNNVLRGIFDTDGTIFTSYKKGSPNYPCIELTTTSFELAKQVKELLVVKGFRVAGIRNYKYKHSDIISHKVSLYGKNNIRKWNDEIGFSNPIKMDKLLKIIKMGTLGNSQ